MKRSILALASLAGLTATPAFAQTAEQYVSTPVPVTAPPPASSGRCGIFETCANTRIGLGRGDFIIRLSAIGVLPEQMRGGTIRLNGANIGGHIAATNQAAPELTFEYFLTDNVSVDLIAASTRHEISAINTVAAPKLDVGSAWVLPPTVTVAWHFRPHKRLNPYVGVGGTMAWFHNVSAAGYRDYSSVVHKVNLGFTGGPSINAGVDYQVVGNWFLNVDVKQIFMKAHAWAENGAETTHIRARTGLDPTVVGFGIEYRF